MIQTSSEQILESFQNIKRTSIKLRESSIEDRRIKLLKLEKWILSNREKIQNALFQDLRKPKSEADLTEIFVVLSELRLARRKLPSWTRKNLSIGLPFLGSSAYVFYEPKGACLIISPWNYPFQLCLVPLISAIAAGNTVILKPSEFTPAVSNLLKALCEEIFDQHEVSVVLGGIPEATTLLAQPFDHIFFTGNTAVGKVVMKAAAKNLASVTLELGGKSPTIVDETADVKDAAQKIAWGKWQNAGQICVAPDYLLVHESLQDRLIEQLTLYANRYYGDRENYASIVNSVHFERLDDLVKEAQQKGCVVVHEGANDPASLTFRPILLTSVDESAKLMQEEIFGPILPIVPYKSLNDAINIINAKPKPLALYLFSSSKKNISLVRTQTSSGMMTINDTVLQFGNPNIPIGGVNHSGIGKSHGHAGFLAFSNEKAVLHQRIGWTMAKTVYPPYSRLKQKMIDLMIKYL